MQSPKVPEGKRVIDAAPARPEGARLARVVTVLLQFLLPIAIDYGALDAATVGVALAGVAVGCVLALLSAKADSLLARVTTRPEDARLHARA